MTVLLIYLGIIVILNKFGRNPTGVSVRMYTLCLLAWPMLTVFWLIAAVALGDKVYAWSSRLMNIK